MDLPMMSLGLFVFRLDTLPYQELQQQLAWRLASNSRVGLRPSYQYLGPDEESITLSGLLLPELTGGDTALSLLRLMADEGKAWPLIEGTGTLYGWFAIAALDIRRQDFFSDGKARRMDFTLSLKRVDESLIEQLGMATAALLDQVA
ncbi:phage tail protein [Chitinivorax sp. B]|uniref:phage tail protein n=1 Tax=Chitinivorax sp. B TaxID=2502235 RepID=UPI002016AC07|nr:phage tail protein [Chitinivorax sp. B]